MVVMGRHGVVADPREHKKAAFRDLRRDQDIWIEDLNAGDDVSAIAEYDYVISQMLEKESHSVNDNQKWVTNVQET